MLVSLHGDKKKITIDDVTEIEDVHVYNWNVFDLDVSTSASSENEQVYIFW